MSLFRKCPNCGKRHRSRSVVYGGIEGAGGIRITTCPAVQPGQVTQMPTAEGDK